ncbi:MAG TPA: hypothetical protein VJ740_17900 [Hyphomicrobiaceae bacterium]|nr:hypothetical protein [Hyphomicrobiaceae bacterium]
MRTVICHFFNEEYLLPWWLSHHRKVFDHGIMIDYASTDASRSLIKEICPTWEVYASRNRYFDSAAIDREVEAYESTCTSWRMALNVTEFLYGNLGQLDGVQEPTQHFIGNYVFVDPMNGTLPAHSRPLHEQVSFGYFEDDDQAIRNLHLGKRASRSLHNYPIRYAEKGGRHWAQRPTLEDVAIFYYGFAMLNEASIGRKLQIRSRMSETERRVLGPHHPNTVGREQFLGNIDRHHRPRCTDLSGPIARLAVYQGYAQAAHPQAWR